MKKVILFFSVLFLSATISYGQLTATVAIDDLGGGLPAGLVTTAVTVEDITGGDNFGTFQLYIQYDPTVLTPAAVNFTNPMMPFYEWSNNLAYAPDMIILTWLSFAGGYTFAAPPAVELCTIDWTYTGDPDRSELVFDTDTKQPVAGWPEKEQSAVWTTFGLQYNLTFQNGGVGPVDMDFMWTGAVDENWDLPGNWSTNMVPDAASSVIIEDVSKAPFPVIYGPAATGALYVFPAATLTVGVFGELTTNGPFTNDGAFYILSDNIGYSGSFIDLGGLAGVGMYSFDRDFLNFAPYGDPGGWHYIASPIDDFETHDMFDFWVNEWNAATQMWSHIEGAITPIGQPCIAGPNVPLAPMDAWSAKWDMTYAGPVNYMGNPDNCEIQFPGTDMMIEFDGPFASVNTGPYGPMAIQPGWNFVGNPYSSCLEPGAIAFGPNTITSIAFWDGWTGNYEYYTATVPFAKIPPTNGFFVEAIGPDILSFSGAERIHDAFNQYWWKSEITDLLTLQATNGEFTDKLHVRFMENYTAQFDNNGDAHKLISEVPEMPQIYTTVGSEMLAINTLPATEDVPMGFTSASSGTYTIEAVETSEFTEVYLWDNVTQEYTDMINNTYTFDYTLGDDPNRFVIHFGSLGIDDNLINSVSIWSNDNNVYVNVPKELKGTITVVNLMGQEVTSTDTEPGLNVIPMDNVNTYYVVKVISNDRAVTGKVYIK